MKPVRIICPSAMAALTLTSILGHEGHPAVWALFEKRPTVLTSAPMPVVTAAIDSAATFCGLNRRAR